MRARTQKSGMYWKGVPGIWVMLPPTEPHSGVRSVQLKDAERLRLPPWDGERNSGVDKEKSEWEDVKGKKKTKKTVKTLDNQEKSRKWMEPTDGDDVEEKRNSTPLKHATHVNIHITCAHGDGLWRYGMASSMQHAMMRQAHGRRLERWVGETGPSEFRAGPPVIASVSDVRGDWYGNRRECLERSYTQVKKGVSDEALGGGGGGGVRKNIFIILGNNLILPS